MKTRPYEPLWIAAVLVVCTLAAPISAIAMAPPADGGVLLVIGPNAQHIVEDAGGGAIGPVSAPWGVITKGDAEFAARARGLGAWHIIDAAWLAAICGQETT